MAKGTHKTPRLVANMGLKAIIGGVDPGLPESVETPS